MENLIAILTLLSTVVIGVGGFAVNALIQRKSNSIEIITHTRLDRRATTQKAFAILLMYSDFQWITMIVNEQNLNERERLKQKTITEMVKAVAQMRALYSYGFREDKELVDTAETLKDVTIEFVNLGKPVEEWEEQIGRVRQNFDRAIDVYMSTEWKRIKLETVGKERKHNPYGAWQELYEESAFYYDS